MPRVGGRTLVRALKRAGFKVVHVRGSHHYLRRPAESALVVVPVHGDRDLPLGTLRSILHQANLSAQQLVDLL